MKEILEEFIKLSRKTEDNGFIETEIEVTEWIKGLVVIGASDTKLTKEILDHEVGTYYL